MGRIARGLDVDAPLPVKHQGDFAISAEGKNPTTAFATNAFDRPRRKCRAVNPAFRSVPPPPAADRGNCRDLLDELLFVVPLCGVAVGIGFVMVKVEYPESMSWPVAVVGSIVSLAVALASFLIAVRTLESV
jgi:hypothetical protein